MMEKMNIAEAILSKGADSAEAILYKGAAVSYGELRENVAGVAGRLLARGHLKGDRVGLFSENNPFFVAAYLGIIRAGLVAVPFQTERTQLGTICAYSAGAFMMC